MKFDKLAIATVAAFGLVGVAQADQPLVQDGLEAAAWTSGEEPKGPDTGYNAEGGVSGAGTGAVWWRKETTAEETLVLPYAGNMTPAAEAKRPTINGSAMATGANFLKVSNSNPLWRMLTPYDKVNDAWPTEFPSGGAVNVPEGVSGTPYNGGLFVDTLVQFTPSEDAPTPESGSKLIVWMNTNGFLCVTANELSLQDGNFVYTKTDYETGTEVYTNTWHRLTVSAFNDVCYCGDGDGSGLTLHGFSVYIDGNAVVANDATVSAAALAKPLNDTTFFEFWCWPHVLDLINAKKFFPSLDYESPSASLSAVGFKGEGLVDDIVVSDVDPFPPGDVVSIDFNLTWPEGVSAVWYAIGTTTNMVSDTSVATNFVSGTYITYGANEAPAWKFVDPVTIELVTNTNCVIAVSDAATGGDAGVTGDLAGFPAAQLQGAFPGATPAQISADANVFLEYQLGQAPNSLSAAPSVEITDISPHATEGWDIKVAVKAGDTSLAVGNMKATLMVIKSDTLGGFASAEPSAVGEVTYDSESKELTFTVTTGGSFFKAWIEYATPANN